MNYTQPEGTAIVAESRLVFIAKAAGTLVAVKAAVFLGATGADRTVDVDVQKSTGGGATATVLSANIQFVDATTDLTVSSGTISASTYAASDIFEVVITVAGAAGNQAQGLIVSLYFEEPTS